VKAITGQPRVRIRVDGADLPNEDLMTLGEIRVQQRLSQPTLCELTFLNPEGPLKTGRAMLPGCSLDVSLHGSDQTLFSGETTAVEYAYGPSHDREVRVRGYDLLHRLRKRQQVRAHLQVTPLDLARELVAGSGITVEAADPGPLHQLLVQQNQTDLDTLVRVAEACGLYLVLHNKTLRLITLEGFGSPVLLKLGDSLLEARVEVNGDPACRSVSVSCWNLPLAQHHTGRASTPRVGRRVHAEAPPSRAGSTGDVILSNEAYSDSRLAESVAQAELDRRIAREVVLRGTAEGDTNLRPGSRVEVSGIAEPIAGQYVLTEVTHVIDGHGGYISEFTTSPPSLRSSGKPAMVTKGQVSRVDDPDNLGRIRVSLPTYDDVETDWMSVVSPGAGSGKGFVALPDIGDQVLVLFVNDDLAQGIVLGGLWGTHGPPDSGVKGGRVRRYTMRTPGGQIVRLDDGEDTIRVENSSGSYVELSPDKVRVHSKADLDVEAPGRAIRIRGKSIDFQEA
jgi:phage baseplate assembly protein gpV/phage protein D